MTTPNDTPTPATDTAALLTEVDTIAAHWREYHVADGREHCRVCGLRSPCHFADTAETYSQLAAALRESERQLADAQARLQHYMDDNERLSDLVQKNRAALAGAQAALALAEWKVGVRIADDAQDGVTWSEHDYDLNAEHYHLPPRPGDASALTTGPNELRIGSMTVRRVAEPKTYADLRWREVLDDGTTVALEDDGIDIHQLLDLRASAASELAALREQIKRLGKAVDRPWATDLADLVDAVESLRASYSAMCDRLQTYVQCNGVGLGGEHVDDLVLERLASYDAIEAWLSLSVSRLVRREIGGGFVAVDYPGIAARGVTVINALDTLAEVGAALAPAPPASPAATTEEGT